MCTDKVLYGQTLAAFWHVHAALQAGIAKNASHEGEKSIIACRGLTIHHTHAVRQWPIIVCFLVRFW